MSSHVHCCEEVDPIDRPRLALALHDQTDDCSFMFGRGECDCPKARQLDQAFARYDDPLFPPSREADEW